ncbi:MAG TPA: MotA/TolQ/ExbB proton channel family protein, partial [Bacteroidetes bacterium]|nr:MotA/TolQ/ExbB proton channel family protein [Bacteroidota bacterium]
MITAIILQLHETAQVLGTEAVKGEISLPIIQLAEKGGWIMAILGVLSVIAVYIFIERYLVISRSSREDKNFMNNIREFILS